MSTDILLAGASVRAAAASALRAGFAPWCVDLFGDADLARACPTRVVALDRYPQGLIETLCEGPTGPWMYTGGLENYTDLLSVAGRDLWGNGADVVRAVRDPWRFAEDLGEFDVPTTLPSDVLPPLPPVLRGERAGVRGDSIPRDCFTPSATSPASRGFEPPHPQPLSPGVPGAMGEWLVKPSSGSSGLGVRVWNGEIVPAGHFLQECVHGEPASAVFVGREGSSLLLGATRQLIGCDWLHCERPFQYAGSIGPLQHPRLESLGQTLIQAFGLRGIFGVDFLLDGDRIRPIEVNPRYPASLEILERIERRALLREHFGAFAAGDVDLGRAGDGTGWKPILRAHGKAIFFAAADLVMPHDGPWGAAFDFRLEDLDVPFADVPAAGQRIAKGDPVLTFFASAESPAACEDELRKIARDLDRVLGWR